VLEWLVIILYIIAVIAIISGIVSGINFSRNVWSGKFPAFIIPFITGIASAVGSVIIAELIKLFLCIEKNTYDAAHNAYITTKLQEELADIQRKIHADALKNDEMYDSDKAICAKCGKEWKKSNYTNSNNCPRCGTRI